MKELIVHRKGCDKNTAHIKASGSKDQYIFNLLVRFCQLNTARVTWEGGTSMEELPLSYWPVGMSVKHFINV